MEGFTGADIESVCKKATLLAIAEYQEGTRGAPFVVSRGDFLAVLASDRGTPWPRRANELNNSAGNPAPAHLNEEGRS